MARMGAAVVCVVVILALDVTAGILGIQAQAAQNKTKKVTVLFIQCEKLVHKAHQLRIAAAVLLAAATLANFHFCCAAITSVRASINRQLAAAFIALILLSWTASIVGFSLLLAGAKSCGFVHGHTLALGGIMCFVHGGITVAYFVTAAAHELP